MCSQIMCSSKISISQMTNELNDQQMSNYKIVNGAISINENVHFHQNVSVTFQ